MTEAELLEALTEVLTAWRWQILLPPQPDGLDASLEVGMTPESCANFAQAFLGRLRERHRFDLPGGTKNGDGTLRVGTWLHGE